MALLREMIVRDLMNDRLGFMYSVLHEEVHVQSHIVLCCHRLVVCDANDRSNVCNWKLDFGP